jgi:spermidine synthase
MVNSEKVLVTRHSAFQAIRLTENADGMRTLRFGADGPSQSIVKVGDPRHLELPYARLLPACLAFAPDPRRVLIVGLGGGSLPRFLHSHFPEMMIDVVELDPEVVALAREYCGFEEDARLRVHVDDGRDFIESSGGNGYDVIVLDSFDTDAIPRHLTTLEFGGAVRSALGPEGIAIANIWGRATNPQYASMLVTYRAAFENVYILDVPMPGTKLFAALQRPQEMTREALIRTAREISRVHGFGYDLGSEIAGFRNSALETVRGGSVLRD